MLEESVNSTPRSAQVTVKKREIKQIEKMWESIENEESKFFEESKGDFNIQLYRSQSHNVEELKQQFITQPVA